MAGWIPLFSPFNPVSKRSTINVSFVNTDEYRFINHLLPAEQYGPSGAAFSTGTTFGNFIDSSGLPNVVIQNTDNHAIGWGVRIPAGTQYGATGSGHYYVVDFNGNGEFEFSVNGFTYQAGPVTGPTGSISSSNISVVTANRWKTTSGANSRMIFNYDGPATLFAVKLLANDPASAGNNVRNMRLYRLDDLVDLNNGNVFRAPYKQQLVDLCPSAIRFMDWHGGNTNQGTRFSNRMLPSYACYGSLNGSGGDWYGSPAYGAMSFVDASLTANQFTVSAAAGTSGNAKTTPVSMTHLEQATIRSDTTTVRTGNVSVSGVTNATPGVVTANSHGFNNGDVVTLQFSNIGKIGSFVSGSPTLTVDVSSLTVGMKVYSENVPAGTIINTVGATTVTLNNNALYTANNTSVQFQAMPKLQNYPVKVANKTTNTFEMQTLAGANVNTSAMGTFGGTAIVTQYVTLNVGGRGAYPIVMQYGTVNASYYGNYIVAGTYNNYIFDKSISLSSDGAGNQIMGVWRMQESPGSSVASDGGGIPLEICAALVNEVNAMSPARTVNMWINIPYMGMSSMDPDYTSADNWGVGIANVVLNGANGYSGLTAPAQLFIEYSNETWNSGGSAFAIAGYLAYRGICRWSTSTPGNYVDMAVLRSVVAMNDIRGSAYNSSRIKTVLAGQGTTGMATGNLNQLRADGYTHDYMRSDASYPNSANAPMTYHNHFAFAGYFACDNFASSNLSTLVSSWASAVASSNTSAQNSAIQSYVDALVNTSLANASDTETIWRYTNTLLPQYVSKMTTYGTSAIMYEGGWDPSVSTLGVPFSQPYMQATLDGSTGGLTGMDSGVVSSITVGDFVYGYGIPAGSTVSAKPTSTSITINKNTTVALTVGGVIVMSPTNAFLWAVKRSSQWSTALQNFFNAFNGTTTGMPADYVQCNPRWGHIWPSAYGYKNAEWTDLSQVMVDEGTRNRALPS